MTFPDAPCDWLELDGVLREHCDEVGRDQSEITRSVHLGFPDDDDAAELADQAGIVLRSRGRHRGLVDAWGRRGGRLEPLADALL